MLVADLTTAILNAKQIFKKIKVKYPTIRIYLVLSTAEGQAPIDSSLEYLLDECDHFFFENEQLEEVWEVLADLFDLAEELRYCKKDDSNMPYLQTEILNLKAKYQQLIPFIIIKDDVEVCLRWDEIDYTINK